MQEELETLPEERRDRAKGERWRVFFVPGMFGFGQLAGYDYFHHLRESLTPEFARAGVRVAFTDVPSPPTSSLRHRARVLATTMAHAAKDGERLQLIGHSTGGLDARLLLSPSADLKLPPQLLEVRDRVETLVTLNTPHFGTPLASYFATVSGARMLYALSLFTIVSLKLGEPSLAIFSRLLAAIGGIDSLIGGDLKLFSRVTDGILRFVDRERRSEITDYLSKVLVDQGAILQISPEAMDLFNAAVAPSPNVRCASLAAVSPPPSSLKAAWRVRSPYSAFTAALYSTFYQFASQPHERYEYAPLTSETKDAMVRGVGRVLSDADNDGIVPSLSMFWGETLGVYDADHLDTLGHFRDDLEPAKHTDWLTSGAQMSRARFASLSQRIATYLLAGRG